jgi:ribosomal protein S18 acetylase RimI-like enzyme
MSATIHTPGALPAGRAAADDNLRGIELLPSTLRDIRAIRALEKVCFGRDAWGYGELLFMFAALGAVRLKAVENGTLIGFICGDPRPADGFAWISTIGVHPDYRRRGVAARLLAECEAQLEEPRLRLTVRAGNAPAIALYERFGYAEIDRWPHYYGDGETGIVMEKARA